MRKVYLIAISVLFVLTQASAQATYTWNAGGAEDYQVASNWTPARITPAADDILAFNATSPLVINNIPLQTIGAIKIASGTSTVAFATNSSLNVLTLSAATPLIFTTPGSVLSADFLTITLGNATAFTMTSGTFGIADGTGGKIIINGALTLSGGTLDFDVNGSGGTTINGSVTYNSGIFFSINTSAITWAAGSNYYHAYNGSGPSAIPAATWVTNSTCNITGMNTGNIAPTGFGSTIFFANVTWNCASQFGNVGLLPAGIGTVVNINGTLTIAATGTKELQLLAYTGSATISAAAYTQTGGTVTLQAASLSTDSTTLSVAGIFSQVGGTLNGVGGASAGTGILDLKGKVTRGSGTAWQSSSSNNGSQFIVQFSGSASQAVDISLGSWNAPAKGRTSVVISNADLVTGVKLTGTLRITNTNSSLPATLTMKGIITNAGACVYSGAGTGGTTLIYSGGFSQNVTGVEFPASGGPTNLTVNNPLGINFPLTNFSRTITGTLTMLGGNIALAGDTLSLTGALANQIAYSGGYITTGTLGRYFPTSGLPTTSSTAGRFPFGSGANDRSLNVFFSSGSLSAGAPGMIYVTHSPVSGVAAISPTIPDNGVLLDKRTLTNWKITTGAFDLGSGGEKISLAVTAANIGSVDVLADLRLVDGGLVTYGTGLAPNPNTGSTSVPTTGKSGLVMADLNKPLYIASDGTTAFNPLINITFNWTGLGGNTDWTNPGNWTGPYAVGFPSASTEIAIISSKGSPSATEPTIKTSDNISLLQLTVSNGMTLTMAGNAILNVYDNVNFTGGITNFAYTSTFGYASSNNAQNILDLPYGSLSISGTASKTLAPSITVTGNYTVSGFGPIIGTGLFTYSYAGGSYAQKIAATAYYDLTITGNRGGAVIGLGTLTGPGNNTITIAHDFKIPATNYAGRSDFNIVDFVSTGSQPIPGFTYSTLRNTGNGPRIYDPLGSANAANVISAISFIPSTGTKTVTGSKVRFDRTGKVSDIFGGATSIYNDFQIDGPMAGLRLDFIGNFYIAGNFSVTATNFVQGNSTSTFYFNGTADQTIPGYKTITASNTPAFKFININVSGGSRKVTLSPTDTVGIKGTFVTSAFTGAGNGFIVAGSTVSFSVGSSTIPLLTPAAGTSNYNNIHVNGGTHNFAANMTIGGNLSVTGVDTLQGVINIGDGNTSRILNVLGNLVVGGGGTGVPLPTGQIDMNTGTTGTTRINLGGNLSITGNGQLMGTTSIGAKSNGVIVFNGTSQTYTNTSTYKNGLVNFTVGDGTTATKLTLTGSSMNLLASAITSNRDTLTVANNASLDCGVYNIISTGSGNAAFNLNAGATLITSNTGGIEGTATNGTNGSIYNGAAAPTITRTYDDLASYTFNGATTTPFNVASAVSKMANLTIGANVSLDKSIQVSKTLTLSNPVNFNFSNSDITLKSTATTTARVAPVPAAASITYGTGRCIVERYFAGTRSWRLITSPLSSNGTPTTIFDQWQNNGVYTPGAGAFVTGPNPVIGTNGLDYSVQNNYSLKTYQNNAYVNIGNTLTPLSNNTLSAANSGYFMFVRGDRSRTPDNTVIPNTNNTTLSSRGKLQYGTQTFPGITRTVVGDDRLFTLVGNPYASPINFDSLTRNNIVKRFVVWDPKITPGFFVTIDDIDDDGVWSYSTPPLGGQDLNIQSSQAFFVETDTLAGVASSLVFNESNKSAVNNLGMFRPLTPTGTTSSFRSSLLAVNADNTTTLVDGNLAEFNVKFRNKVDLQDALKVTNLNESFGLLRDNSPVAIERRKEISIDDTLYFKLSRTTQRNYRFEFEPIKMNPLLTAFLEDRYTGDKTPVSVTSPTTFSFSVNGDPKSADPTRFRIVFKAAEAVLPVTYSSIKAYQKNADIAVEWTVENEIGINKYEVEKSLDGVNFTRVNISVAKASNGRAAYGFIDVKALPGNNFYRIASYNKTGAVEYSRIVVVKIGKTAAGLSVYPNPVKGNSIGLAFSNMKEGQYNIKLINTLGQTLLVQQINHVAGSSMETLTPNSQLSAGVYQLEITSPDNHVTSIKMIAQ